MSYTIKQMAELAGVSARTLRYYNSIGLLSPMALTQAGYRLYGPQEVEKLRQILFYRELGLPLEAIAKILNAPQFDALAALVNHRSRLLQKRTQLDALLANLEKSIAEKEGRVTMQDAEKFEGFKKRLIEQNEEKYGREVREKYGDEAADASNAKIMNLTQEQYEEMQAVGEQVLAALDAAWEQGCSPAGQEAGKAVELHRQWLSYTWGERYSPQAHASLAEMYAADERFAAYYNRGQKGKAEFFRDAILAHI